MSEACFDVIQECTSKDSGRSESPELTSIVNDVVQQHLTDIIYEIAYETVNELIYTRIANEYFDRMISECIVNEAILEEMLIEREAEVGLLLILNEYIQKELWEIVLESSRELKIKAVMKRPHKLKSKTIDAKMQKILDAMLVEECAAILAVHGMTSPSKTYDDLIGTAIVEQAVSLMDHENKSNI